MRKPKLAISFAIFLFISSSWKSGDIWGFYVHKLINQHAIYLLPTELIPSFKLNLKELRHFAIAPDQRKHSSPHEAARHYIDIDQWGSAPFSNVPRDYSQAVWKFGNICFVNTSKSDTLFIKKKHFRNQQEIVDSTMKFFFDHIRFDDAKKNIWNIRQNNFSDYFKNIYELNNYDELVFVNQVDKYGILPYHLLEYQERLKWAFISKDLRRIIRLAGEMGHYIGDAHVPLHTTLNYNGQLTGQDGLHAFWETRIPELFAHEYYDFWNGTRTYIEDKENYFWNMILTSHDLVDDVLNIEKDMRNTFPSDNQYCFDERLGVTQRIECEAYARAYQNAMNGMVENRMKDAIQAIASSWYTAWVDAGSPLLEAKKVLFEVPKESPQNGSVELKIKKD